MVKKDEARSKYEQTYLMDLENLIPYGSDKKAYEKRIEDIIKALHRNSNYQYFMVVACPAMRLFLGMCLRPFRA